MKKNILPVLAATAVYSYLFYEQNPGFNHLVFSLVLIPLFALGNPPVIRNATWWLAAVVCLVSGLVTAVSGSPFNLLMNMGSMALLASITATFRISVISAGFYAFLSAISGLFLGVIAYFEKYVSYNSETVTRTDRSYKWYHLLLPSVIVMLFVFLYRNASGAFAHLTDQINLSFISIEWVVFTIFGFIFLYGLFNPPAQLNFLTREASIPNSLEEKPRWMSRGFNFTGITLFVLLDLLLLTVNVTDMIYLFIIGKENLSVSHSELIHQGIDALTVSVILAVVFILLWLNQLRDQEGMYRKLRYVAIAWVLLNIVLIATNTYKNYQYITAHGLTYKRIGVYFFLTLAMLTLLFCWIKIRSFKTNFFMYRRFGLALLLTCMAFNIFNWDRIIARYNIERYKNQTLEVDAEYLLTLSDDCLPLLLDNRELLNPGKSSCFDEKLNARCRKFINRFDQLDWRSRTWNQYITYQYLETHHVPGKSSEPGCNEYSRY